MARAKTVGGGTIICPYCGRRVVGQCNLARHIIPCSKMPEREELEKLVDAGWSQRMLCERYEVTDRVVRAWLDKYGLRTKATTGPRVTVVKKVGGDELAPYFGVQGCPCGHGCEEECLKRARRDQWVLCERPPEEEVERAKEMGWL